MYKNMSLRIAINMFDFVNQLLIEANIENDTRNEKQLSDNIHLN